MIPLLDAALKGSAIVLIAFVVLRLWRSRPAAARHLVLASALVCAAAVPLVGMAVPSWRVETPAPMSAVNVTYEAVLPGTAGTAQASSTVRFPMATVLAAMWIGGVAVGLLIVLTGLARLAWIARNTTPVESGAWAAIAIQLAGEFGLARPPRLLQSDHPALLVTWGFIDPKVLLPEGAAAWTESRVRVALAHELAHVRRRDWIVQIGADLLRSVYWFNPLLWIGCARLRQESEQACDDAVLRLGVGGTAYAGHLLDLARAFRAHRRVWLPAPAIARPSSLERRVRAMLN
ncbi:MAG: M56 family metallopeptidase, partial [Gammaproteobacteria bacterium]